MKWFKSHKGFTLIEIIILIVIAGIILPVIIVPFVTVMKGSEKPEMATTAMYLAHQKMEELMKYNYSNAALNTTALTAYSDIDAVNFPNYQWQREIVYVLDSDLNATGSVNPPDTRYKRILIRIRDPENDTYEVYSVVTRFP